MGWTYADYESQATDALRLARARQFYAELAAANGASVGAQGSSRDPGNITEMMRLVREDIQRYERRIGKPAGGMVKIRRLP